MKRKIFIMLFFTICCFWGGLIYIWNKYNSMENIIEMNILPVDICYTNAYWYCIGRTCGEQDTMENKLYVINSTSYEYEEVKSLSEDNLIPKKITSCEDKIYIITYSAKYNEYYVVRLEKEKIIYVLNLNNYMDTENIFIKGFCITEEQMCYIREETNKMLLIIDLKKGEKRIIQDNIEKQFFECMAVGEHGNLYMLFCREQAEGGDYVLYKIKRMDIEIENEGMLLPYDDLYSVMGGGNNIYDFYVKSINAVYGYNTENKKFSYITKIENEMYEYTKSYFSSDGRLMYIGMNLKQKNNSIVNCVKFLEVRL